MTQQDRVATLIGDPTREFSTPMQVVRDEALGLEDKRKILESWRKDAELLSTAQDENMTGGERPQLQDVHLALEELERLSGQQH
jgi:hypothetical protein